MQFFYQLQNETGRIYRNTLQKSFLVFSSSTCNTIQWERIQFKLAFNAHFELLVDRNNQGKSVTSTLLVGIPQFPYSFVQFRCYVVHEFLFLTKLIPYAQTGTDKLIQSIVSKAIIIYQISKQWHAASSSLMFILTAFLLSKLVYSTQQSQKCL